MTWDPELYDQFKNERAQPFFDLIDLVEPRPNMKVIDLGCGTGVLTSKLVSVFPNCSILGIDSSPSMLVKAVPLTNDQLKFEQGNQETFSGSWDLIFSNAALQWSDDHPGLFSKLFGQLNHDGQLAIQIPSNHNSIFHQAIRQTAAQEPFVGILNGYFRSSPVLTIEEYAKLFYGLYAKGITVFEKIYPHVLADIDQVVQGLSGTALLPYLDRIADKKADFISALKNELKKEVPLEPFFYPFKRIFIYIRK